MSIHSLSDRLRRLHTNGQLPKIARIDTDTFGYRTSITYRDGSIRHIVGRKLGVNPDGATALAEDKTYTKQVLIAAGIAVSKGESFLLPHRAAQIDQPTTAVEVTAAINSFVTRELNGYPAYLKPNNGSLGSGVHKVESPEQLAAIVERYSAQRVHLALVEEPFTMPDFRLVITNGELTLAYQRLPLSVIGDDEKTVRTLVQEKLACLKKQRSIPIERVTLQVEAHLGSELLDSVPRLGEHVSCLPISNLSAGGSAIDFTSTCHPSWIALGQQVGKIMGLRHFGLDIACAGITKESTTYIAIEVNPWPGVEHFAALHPACEKTIDEMYISLVGTAM